MTIPRHFAPIVLLLIAFYVPAAASAPPKDPPRDFNLTWTITADGIPEGAKKATVWISVPQELPEQTVKDLRVSTDYDWTFVEDPDFKNRAVRVEVPNPSAKVRIDLSAVVHRIPVAGPVPAELSPDERKLYLRDEALVSLSPRIRQIAQGIQNSNRARYDYVLDLMTYDKTIPGWGNGDSERACDVKKGNCTDFHSLFMSLSRVEGVPVRFEMGYPTVSEGETGKTGGYHCWAWFYDETAKGWTPVDISEADKHPERSDYFYGHLDADRITFSKGRDVKLPGMKGKPLNYFPAGAYAEVDGTPLDQVTRTLTYTVDTAMAGSRD